jgi:hypothetical protein
MEIRRTKLGLVRFGRNGPFRCSIRVDCHRPVLKPDPPQLVVRFGLAQERNLAWFGHSTPFHAWNKARPPTLWNGVRPETAQSSTTSSRDPAATGRSGGDGGDGGAVRDDGDATDSNPTSFPFFVLLAGDPSLSPSSSSSLPPLGFLDLGHGGCD